MKVNDAVSGGIAIALAALIFYFTRDFRVMPGQNYGAAFFPRTIATAMGILGLVLVIQGIRTRATVPWAVAMDWVHSRRHVANFVMVIAVLVFYIFTSDWLGFLIAGFISLFTLTLWLRGRAHLVETLVLSVVCVIALQLFFGQVLRVPLPWGLLQDYAW